MAHPARFLLLSACLLVVASTQKIAFNAGGDACEVSGRAGACMRIEDCQENMDHLRNRNIPALRAAISTCGGPRRGSYLLCCTEGARFRNHPQCGQGSGVTGHIVGGRTVLRLQDFPWMAALKWRPNGKEPLYRCGGAVINERWVLTAAHCVSDNGPAAVRIRDRNLKTTTDDVFLEPPEDVQVELAIRHPNYSLVIRRPNAGRFSDIALLKLNRDIVFSDISKPLCLPEKQRPTAEYERLSTALIAGWGLTEFDGEEASPNLMWASVNISVHNDCQLAYRRAGVRVDDSEHLCAVGNDLKQPGCVPDANDGSCEGGVDACQGDSGGPLMLSQEHFNLRRWYAIGVISAGRGCGNSMQPGRFTRVDHFLDWIAETVAGN